MPYTINGVGNAYYGKQRVHSIHSTCEFCGVMSVLKSYDTTNYIVVLYIPIIPLGGLRIINECSACNKFRCLPLKQWESSKKKAIEEMKVELASDDDSSLPVKKAIGVAISYQDVPLLDTVANSFGKSMVDDHEVQELLGDAFAYFGRHKEATGAFKKALDVKPDPLVSDRLALAYMRSGDPINAAPLAQQSLASGDVNRLWVPQLLINSFQGINDHEQAKSWLGKIESAAPAIVATKPFQQLQKSVEKGLKKGKPIVDPFLSNQGIEVAQTNQRKFSFYYIVGPAVLAAIFAIYIGLAIHRGNNQRVIVVNSLGQAYSVKIGDKKLLVTGGGTSELKLGQGEWSVEPVPNNPVEINTSKFEIKTPFWSRPFSNPIFLVNPDGLGVFVRETTYYAENPGDAPAGQAEMYAGKTSYQFPSTDYVFQPFPEQLKLESSSKSTARTRLGQEIFENGEITKVLSVAMNPDLNIDLLDYLEARILLYGDSDYLASFLAKLSPEERFLAFAKKHLDDKPIRLSLHREYQNLMRNADKMQPLVEEYIARQKAEPDSSDLTYLLARITEDEEQAERLWSQLAKDPKISDAARAGCGARLLSRGSFKEAAEMVGKMARTLPNQPMAQMQRLSILESAKRYREVTELCRELREPLSDIAMQFGVRAVHGMSPKDSKSATTAFIDALPSIHNAPRVAVPVVFFDDQQKATMKAYAAYANKDLAEFETILRTIPEAETFELDAANGNIEPYLNGGAKAADPDAPKTVWSQFATLALSAHRKGNIQARNSFVEECVKSLEGADFQERKLALLLKSKDNVDLKAFRNLPASPREKSLVAAILIFQHPDQAAQLAPIARLFNYEKSPPFWLIDDVISAVK